jgi:hypothetical protein
MLETILSLSVIVNASVISLGVGSSTLAITSFLTALKDGKIDESERRMLGVIYILLRISMVAILLTTLIITSLRPDIFGSQELFIWILVGVLYVNAFLMTKHWIPMKIGPALQAATWYTLGFVVTIRMFALYDIDVFAFILLYLADITVALVALNGWLWFFKKRSSS